MEYLKQFIVKNILKFKKVKSGDIALNGTPISELRSVTCRMGSHSVICHPTQVNTPRLNTRQIGWYSIYLPRRDGRLS